MKRSLTATALGLVLLASGAAAIQAGAFANSPAVVAKVDNFRLVTAEGRALELYRLKDASAVVLVSYVEGDSGLKKMAPQLAQLKAEYAGKGVEFLLVNSSLKSDREASIADVAKLGLDMTVVMDDLQLVGEQLGAPRAGEVFVVNPKTWAVAYRGPLADGKSAGKAYAANAIKAVVAGEAVTVASKSAKGTKVAYPNASAKAKASFTNISYSETIAPIIEEKCVACHQEGGIGPFSFTSYEMVKGFAPMIREAVRTDRMPPWDVDPHVGKFKDDKSLSSDQIKSLVHWIEAGAPRGAGEDPLAAERHVAPEWPLGKPDLIVDIPAYTVPASGVVDYQYPTTPNPLKEGKWLKAATAKVSQRQAVHHILSGIIPEGQTQKGMQAWGGSVGGYTVGMESTVAPKGIGSWVPAGGQFAYQMHYTPFGKEVTSAEQIGLYFYKDNEKPDLIMRENALVDQFIEIPANEGAHEEIAYFLFPKDAILHTAVVHAHYRGTYSKLELYYPDGKKELILNVPFYDFNWQRMYEFETPINIPAGTKAVATYVYDNSKRNPANPNPEEKIVWGDQSFEEMFYTSLRYRWADETVANPTENDQLLLKTRLLGMLDDNLDDKVQMSELRGQFKQQIGNPMAFGMVDKNKDGGIDMAEFESVMSMMRRPKAASSGE